MGIEDRKEVLRRLLEAAPPALRFSDHVRGQGAAFFEAARKAGLEGVVSKRAGASYRDGRGGDWRKAKCRLTQEAVIGGFTISSDGGSIGALLVGFHEDERLVYAGKVGSGLAGRLLADLEHRLESRRRKTMPFAEVPAEHRRDVKWVEPDLVAQVEFSEWTDEGRMRQPVLLGLREDREARHVVRERPGMIEGGGVDTVSAGRPWEALRSHATRTHGASGEEVVDLLGVRLTHPDRVYYPDLGFTKLDLALYYVSIADTVLPLLEDRPLTLVRCPDGVGGESFYQKHPGFWTLPQVRRVPVPGESEDHLYVDSVPGLVALAQAGILEIHPWNSRASRLEEPDQVIFDLDPDLALPFSRVAAGARRVRALLVELGLESFVKTTGGKGLHVCVPLRPERGWDELADFTRAVATRLARDEPEAFTANMAKAQRKGRIYVDYLRNVRGANAVGAYSTRARAGAPVSAPSLGTSSTASRVRPTSPSRRRRYGFSVSVPPPGTIPGPATSRSSRRSPTRCCASCPDRRRSAPQRDRRVDARSAPGRDQAGQQGDAGQRDADRGQDQRVGCADAEGQALEAQARQQRTHRPGGDARERRRHALADHETHDVTRLRAECGADPDLQAAPAHDVGQARCRCRRRPAGAPPPRTRPAGTR